MINKEKDFTEVKISYDEVETIRILSVHKEYPKESYFVPTIVYDEFLRAEKAYFDALKSLNWYIYQVDINRRRI